MAPAGLPTRPEDLSVEQLNAVLAAHSAGVALQGFAVTESHLWGGGQASSAGRIVIAPAWAPGAPAGLPKSLVVKVAKTDPDSDDPEAAGGSGALYRNEVAVYTRLKPASFLEAPVVFGGAYDEPTGTFLLLLEDLRERGAQFGAVTRPVSLETLRSLLGQLAALHARWWDSPELGGSLDWMERHTRGALQQMFAHALPPFVAHQVETTQFKREMVERLGVSLEELHRGFQAVQRHQAGLPQTVCHGDTHVGNTYALPDGSGGLLDWQLASQGFCLHDVAYLVATALPVAERRAHERELLAEYRERLRERGVAAPPSLEELWREYRRAMVWGLYVGWLITPVVNYGWEITVMNHLRMMTAFEDLETKALIRELA